jgi:hypothetical protein
MLRRKKQRRNKATAAKALQAHKAPARASMAAASGAPATNPNTCKYNAGGTRRCVKSRLETGPFCAGHQCPTCPGFKSSRDDACTDCVRANQGTDAGAPTVASFVQPAVSGYETGYNGATPTESTAVTPSGSVTALDAGYIDISSANYPTLPNPAAPHQLSTNSHYNNGDYRNSAPAPVAHPRPVRVLLALPAEYDGWGDKNAEC